MEITELHNRLLERKTPAALLSVVAHDPEQELYFHADGSLGYLFLCYPIVGVDERIVQQVQPSVPAELDSADLALAEPGYRERAAHHGHDPRS